MQKRVLLSGSLRCIVVLSLAIVISMVMMAMSMGAYADTHTIFAANGYSTQAMSGVSIGTDKSVTYDAFARTDTGKDGAAQMSYYPTNYLELAEYGTHDLSRVLQRSVNRVDTTPANADMCYHDDPASRVVGIERRGNMKLIDNSRYGDAGYGFAGWGEKKQGPGVYYRNVEYATGTRSGVLYLTLAIPDSRVSSTHELRVGIDSTTFAQSTNSRVDAAFAVFADPASAGDTQMMRWNGDIMGEGGIGIPHEEQRWVVPGSTPNTARVNTALTFGATRVGEGSLFSDVASGNKFRECHHALDADVYSLPQGTKYIRIVIISDIGANADLAITNLKVGLEGFGPAPYTLESMGADTNGRVTYTRNNSRNGSVAYTASESVDGSISYFPTSYLLPTMDTDVDMTAMLGDIVGNGASCYPSGRANRLIGVERRGVYEVHNEETRNGGLGLTYWRSDSAYSDTQNGTTLGSGLSVQSNTSAAGSMAFYFTMALPEHLVAREGEYTLNWSFNTKSFGEDVGAQCHRLSAGYAVYADTKAGTGVAAPIQSPVGRVSDESMGFDHSEPWSIQPSGETGYNLREDRANGLIAVPNAHGTIYSEIVRNTVLDRAVRLSVPVPADTRLLRFVVTFDQDNIANVTRVKQALTNMHVSISDSGYRHVSLEAIEGTGGVAETQQVMLRADTAGTGKALADIEQDIVIHAISPYTGEEWSSSYSALPTSDNGVDTVVWRSGTYESITRNATDAAGETIAKTYEGVDCHTRLHTRASRVWVTFGEASDERYRTADIAGVDKGAPSVLDTHIEMREVQLTTITLMLDEQSDIASATISGAGMDSVPMTIDNVAKSVTHDVRASGDYVVSVTDEYGYTMSVTIQDVTCYIGTTPALGKGVEIVGNVGEYVTSGEAITYRFTSTSYGYRLQKPISVVAETDIVEVYNYGMVAEYTITYTDSVDSSILCNIVAIDTHVTIDNGEPEVVPFGDARTYTASVPEGHTFVGWYDKAGILASSSTTITLRPTRDVVLTTRSIPTNEVMIRFENMSGKTLDVQGYRRDGRSVEDIVASINRSILEDIPHGEYTAIRLPVSPFETFAGWRIVDESDPANIVVRSVYETQQTFTITVDGTPHEVYANTKISLEDYATADTRGWQMGDKVVSTTSSYECYAMADMTFTSVDVAPDATMMTTTVSRGTIGETAVTVISGQLNSTKAYSEVGFILMNGNIEDRYLRVDSGYAMRVVTYSVKGGQNMIILSDSAFRDTEYGNAKYRLYAIDATTGEAEYSAVCSL